MPPISGDASYTILPSASAAEWPILRSFYRTEFRANHPLGDRRLYAWYLERRSVPVMSAQSETQYSAITARIGDRVIGHIGAMEVPVRLGEDVLNGAWYISIYVIDAFRGRGVASALVNAGLQHYDIVMGLGSSEEGLALYQRCGYTRLGYLTRRICVLDPTAVGPLMRPNATSRAATVLSYGAKVNGNRLQRIDDQRLVRIEAPRVFDVPSGYAELWQQVCACFSASVARTPNYMHWRYSSNPHLRYFSFAARDQAGTLSGLLVFRIDGKRTSTAPVARIAELMAGTDEVAMLLLNALCRYARRQGAAMAEFYCSSPIYGDAFDACGFFSDPNPLVRDVRRLYHPPRDVSPARIPLSFKTSANLPDRVSSQVKSIDQWYVTLGDSDIDRLQR